MTTAVYTIVPVEAFDEATAALFPESARFAGNLFLVAVAAGGPAGVAVYRRLGGDEAELLYIQTLPAWRRRGVAAALLRDLLHRCPGAVFLEVRESNHAARQLYRAAGFEEVGIRTNYYSDPIESAIVMKFHS